MHQSQFKKQGPVKQRDWAHRVKSLGILLITGFILKQADVYGVMTRSQRLNFIPMYISYACYAIFSAIWFYTVWFLQPKHPHYEETHVEWVYAATISVLGGGLFWTIGIWPVFHFWTLPLGLACLFFFVSLLDWVPGIGWGGRGGSGDATKLK